MDKPIWMWAAFIAIVLVLLILDLGVFNKKDHEIGVKESLYLSCFYIVIGLLFSVWIWYQSGITSMEEYLTGYLIEKSLSLDNIFVISLVFEYLRIPRLYQHRVLFWGILGVIVLRGLMIGLGAKLVAEFSWVLYIFAIFLIFTGIKMLFVKEHQKDMSENKLLTFIQSHLRVTKELHGNHFFVSLEEPGSKKKLLWCTPLFVALLMIEMVDAVFAVDSVPAIFAITTDTYIIYTSNIFAILGLRALYFALAAVLPRFVYLKYALSLVLIFIGSKIFIADFFGWNKFPASVSLAITVSLLAAGILFSLYKTRGNYKNTI
jgi:tellurite resistance protein TerC